MDVEKTVSIAVCRNQDCHEHEEKGASFGLRMTVVDPGTPEAGPGSGSDAVAISLQGVIAGSPACLLSTQLEEVLHGEQDGARPVSSRTVVTGEHRPLSAETDRLRAESFYKHTRIGGGGLFLFQTPPTTKNFESI